MALSIIFTLIILCCNGTKNSYNMNALLTINDWYQTNNSNTVRMDIFRYIMTLEAKGKREMIHKAKLTDMTHYHPKVISRFSNDPNRKHPQTVTTFWSPAGSHSYVVVYVASASNEWDYKHQYEWQPTTVQLNLLEHDTTMTISVHSGVYNAINDEAFYKPFLKDILHKKRHYERARFTQLILSGHGFGGSLISLFAILWKGNADCPAINYLRQKTRKFTETHYRDMIQSTDKYAELGWHKKRATDTALSVAGLPERYVERNQVNKRLRELLNEMQVITFGAFGVVSSHSRALVRMWLDIRVFHNVIRATDPLPMMFNGVHDDSPPKEAFKARHYVVLYAHALYAPLGEYIVVMKSDDVAYRLKPLRCALYSEEMHSTRSVGHLKKVVNEAYDGHLVKGAESLRQELLKRVKESKGNVEEELNKMIEEESAHNVYKEEIDTAVNMYAYSVTFDEPLLNTGKQSMLIFMIEVAFAGFILCCISGGLFGYYAAKYFVLKEKQDTILGQI
eukprot:100816_1